MSTPLRDALIGFYSGSRYDVSGTVPPPRPREWHLPLQVWRAFSEGGLRQPVSMAKPGSPLIVPLDGEDLLQLRSTILHEALFAFYKGLYNYLAARRLYGGGLLHWIEITTYYAKLYLARATITLCGIQKYYIRSDSGFFVPEIFQRVSPNRYAKLLAVYKTDEEIDYNEERVGYSMSVDLGLTGSPPQLVFDTSGVDSHQYIWHQYHSLGVERLGLTSLLLPEAIQNYRDLIDERNQENYSFEGYMQLDFNLPMPNFTGYFERDFVKRATDILYDDVVGMTLLTFQELYHLFGDLEVENLPLETEKLAHIIEYTLDDSPAKTKLLDLCKRGFPIQNEYHDEGLAYIRGDL